MTFKEFAKELKDLDYEVKHRSGLFSSNTKDGSVSELIHTVVDNDLRELLADILEPLLSGVDELSDDLIAKYKDEYINRWMILHHNIIVKHNHFNWNWP